MTKFRKVAPKPGSKVSKRQNPQWPPLHVPAMTTTACTRNDHHHCTTVTTTVPIPYAPYRPLPVFWPNWSEIRWKTDNKPRKTMKIDVFSWKSMNFIDISRKMVEMGTGAVPRWYPRVRTVSVPPITRVPPPTTSATTLTDTPRWGTNRQPRRVHQAPFGFN